MLNIASGILLIAIMKKVINQDDILIYVILHNCIRTDCHFVECHSAEFHSSKWHYLECHSNKCCHVYGYFIFPSGIMWNVIPINVIAHYCHDYGYCILLSGIIWNIILINVITQYCHFYGYFIYQVALCGMSFR